MSNHDSESFRNGATCAIAIFQGMRNNEVFKTDPKLSIRALFEVVDEFDIFELERIYLSEILKNG